MTLNWSRVIVLVAAVASFSLTVSLGQWQLRRADAKQAAQALIEARSSLPPWRNADWPCESNALVSLPLQRPVVLRGRWLHARTVLLENRNMGGLSGYDVVTPLQLDPLPASACKARFVLVQRGFVPRDPRDRLKLPTLPFDGRSVTVVGRLVAEPSRVYSLGTEALTAGSGPVVRQNVDQGFWLAWLGQVPLAGAVLQLQSDQAVADDGAPQGAEQAMLSRNWPAPDVGRGKHLAYAVQWFAMAAIIAGLYVWHQLILPRRHLVHVKP
jgi:surfeit locus 1 family protein